MVIIIFIVISPSILATPADIYPNNYNTPKGYHHYGTLTSFTQKFDGDEIYWSGASYWW